MTPDEILKSKLTPDEQAIVYTAIKVQVAKAKGESLTAWLKGALKSWTVWLGGFLVALPELLPLLDPAIKDMLDADTYRRVMQIAGIAVILVRFRTTQPLNEKVKQ